uniref:Uncharacterized protein n=1 Tax=Lotus japonicus TaxID=34305 RepID=I3SKY1_LOTJA|nr:unknown [Lotus japonicus]
MRSKCGSTASSFPRIRAKATAGWAWALLKSINFNPFDMINAVNLLNSFL